MESFQRLGAQWSWRDHVGCCPTTPSWTSKLTDGWVDAVQTGSRAPWLLCNSVWWRGEDASTLNCTAQQNLCCWQFLFSVLQIHYWERDKQNQTEKVKVIFVPDTHVHLTNLTSYTPYLITLTAFNTAGDGPPSDPRGARTLQSGRKLECCNPLKPNL